MDTIILLSIGAILRLLVLNILFMIQRERQAIPDMPPLAAGTILGFLISFVNFKKLWISEE